MNDDQRAKFEKWAADADKRDRRRAVGRVDAWEGWCACLAANAIDQPAGDEREREMAEACRDLLSIVADAITHGMPITPAVADARNKAVAALGTREDGG